MREFVEVESGKQADRPELAKALIAAKVLRLPLVVAKVDRLARNVRFLEEILASGVEVISATSRRYKARWGDSSFSRWLRLRSLRPASSRSAPRQRLPLRRSGAPSSVAFEA